LATITQIRAGIETRLVTLEALRVAQEWGEPINVSGNASAAVVEYAGATYDDAFAGQGDALLFGIILLVSKSSDRTGRDKLDAFCDPTPNSVTSIRTAVNGTLGGLVAAATVASSGPYQEYSPGETPYLGTEFVVRVMT
jgi:hypothetical protein